MVQLDWWQCPALECKQGGECVPMGTRLPVRAVFENLAAGMSTLEISRTFGVQPEAVAAVLLFVSERLKPAPAARKNAGPKPVRQAVSYLAGCLLIVGALHLEGTNRLLAIFLLALSVLAMSYGLFTLFRWKNQQSLLVIRKH